MQLKVKKLEIYTKKKVQKLRKKCSEIKEKKLVQIVKS